MSADPARRLDRLREVLPSIYDTRPGDSLLGTVLLRVARELAGMDEAQRRVLHDRWLPLATGAAEPSYGMPALDRLGALLDTSRLAGAGDGPSEAAEAYRARIAITARALSGGMATPRTLLSLALAAVGAEPCPRLRTRHAARLRPEDPWVVEATEARGMPPGTRRRCSGCRGGDGACPLEGQAPLAEAYLVENPVTQCARPVDAAYWRAFPVESRSLTTDRPLIRLSPLGAEALSNPAVQNRATGEITLFQGFVRPGETLVLFPAMGDDELRPFDSIESEAHHPWTRGTARGRAVLRSAAGERDVSAAVFFMSGSRLDDLNTVYAGPAPDQPDPAEVGTRFAEMEQAVRTPRLRPGTDPWRLLQFARSESAFWSGPGEPPPRGHEAEEPPRFADAGSTEGTRFAILDSAGREAGLEQARLLFDLLRRAEEAARTAPPGPPVAALELEWLVRPPATVRISLVRSAQVEAAQAHGAVDLLLRDLDLARPAGVRTLFEIRERPLPREALEPAEADINMRAAARWREEGAPDDRLGTIAVRAPMPRESHPVADRQPIWSGRFDGTTFDSSRLM